MNEFAPFAVFSQSLSDLPHLNRRGELNPPLSTLVKLLLSCRDRHLPMETAMVRTADMPVLLTKCQAPFSKCLRCTDSH